jgi:hypothetical protein
VEGNVKTYDENFEKLYFTECVLGKAVVSGETMRIQVRGLFVLRGHPLLSVGYGPHSGWFVFNGVTHSSRTVTEYIGDPKAPEGFKDPYSVEDEVPSLASTAQPRDYAFEGLQDEPCAWVDNWIVRAASFQLQIQG